MFNVWSCMMMMCDVDMNVCVCVPTVKKKSYITRVGVDYTHF